MGILIGGLGVAAVAVAFGAPSGLALAAPGTPVATAAAGQPNGARPPFGGPGRGPGGPRGFIGPGSLDSLASFLGMTTTDLQTALRNGQTLAQVAQAHGKSTADLKTFLTNQLKTRLDQDVASGRITSQQETDFLNNASSRIDQEINGTFPKGGPRGPGGPGGFGFGLDPASLQTVAQTLGMNETDVRTALQNGQTLAQIAQAHGKTSADVENALLAAYKTRLDQLMNTNFQQLRQQRQAGKSATPAPAAATPTATATSG
jgi:hypothetical protein